MKKTLQRIYPAIPMNLRGRVAYIPKPEIDDPNNTSDFIPQCYEKYLKLNKMHKSLEYNYPNLVKRLGESLPPGQVRRTRKEDLMRKKHREEVRYLCEWFMWSQGAYKPPKKQKIK